MMANATYKGFLVSLLLVTSSKTSAFIANLRNSPISTECTSASSDYMSRVQRQGTFNHFSNGRRNTIKLTKRDTFLEASSSSADEVESSTVTVEDTESSSTDNEDTSSITPKSGDSITPTNVNANDFDNILQTRRTINSFQPTLPDNWEQTLQTAIESATFAPNHKRTEPWRFHLLGPETIRRVCELNASIVAAKKGEKAGEKKLERWLQMPGWLVVTSNGKISCEKVAGDQDEEEGKEGDCESAGVGVGMNDPSSLEREDYAACCCAIQNFCLSLHYAGMGTKWTTGPVNFDERFSEIVGLDDDEYVVGTIWFGTPETIPNAPVKKKSLDDVLIRHD